MAIYSAQLPDTTCDFQISNLITRVMVTLVIISIVISQSINQSTNQRIKHSSHTFFTVVVSGSSTLAFLGDGSPSAPQV
jgi:hypothetical protein